MQIYFDVIIENWENWAQQYLKKSAVLRINSSSYNLVSAGCQRQ